jgi:hypothetical protein
MAILHNVLPNRPLLVLRQVLKFELEFRLQAVRTG